MNVLKIKMCSIKFIFVILFYILIKKKNRYTNFDLFDMTNLYENPKKSKSTICFGLKRIEIFKVEK